MARTTMGSLSERPLSDKGVSSCKRAGSSCPSAGDAATLPPPNASGLAPWSTHDLALLERWLWVVWPYGLPKMSPDFNNELLM